MGTRGGLSRQVTNRVVYRLPGVYVAYCRTAPGSPRRPAGHRFAVMATGCGFQTGFGFRYGRTAVRSVIDFEHFCRCVHRNHFITGTKALVVMVRILDGRLAAPRTICFKVTSTRRLRGFRNKRYDVDQQIGIFCIRGKKFVAVCREGAIFDLRKDCSENEAEKHHGWRRNPLIQTAAIQLCRPFDSSLASFELLEVLV